jgi:hypothetical protein
MPEDIEENSKFPVELATPAGAANIENPWVLLGYNKKVLKGWVALCHSITANATRCFEWLQAHPTMPIRGRCYELKHKHYAGCWAYEIGSGDRVYYKPRPLQRDVLIYYAGKHPSVIPYPPSDI